MGDKEKETQRRCKKEKENERIILILSEMVTSNCHKRRKENNLN
jgi:hypothetical protein